MKNLIFYLGVSMLFTHELDAVLNNEWRVLPLTSWLPDEMGQLTFIAIHIPLFAILLALISSRNELIRHRTRFGISVFLPIHGIFHLAFMTHENYEFESVISNFLIFAGSVCGLLYLVLNQKHWNLPIK